MDEAAINKAIADGVKAGVQAALENELKPFYIDKEEHFEHHKFIREWIDWMQQCKSVVLKTIVGAVVLAAFGLMAAGFIFKHSGK
jgi:hypothetical protein